MAIKAQALANFIVEFTHVENAPNSEVGITKEMEAEENDGDTTGWKLFMDGLFNQYDYGTGLILQIPSSE